MIDTVAERRNRSRGGVDTHTNELRRRYDAHAQHLYGIAVAVSGDRSVAEDIVHEAFLRLHRTAAPPALDSEAAYLRRIVVNLATDHHRRSARQRRLVDQVGRATPASAPAAEVGALNSERDRLVAEAVASLPERQRDCVVLHYFAGLNETEIAAELGIAVGSIKSHLHRGRAALATALEALR